MEFTSKDILDKWATYVLYSNVVYLKDGESKVNTHSPINYTNYTGDEILWIPPKNCITLEFEGTQEENKRIIAEIESAAKSLGFDYCVTGHNGKSDYFRMFNIDNMPVNEDNKIAKELLYLTLMPSGAIDKLDKSNLGWTYSPVIGHKHWKAKYNGAIHQIIRGKHPLEQKNEYPKDLLKKVDQIKNKIKSYYANIKKDAPWVEDFLLNYCCNNELPKGQRHSVIEKNLAALIINRDDKEQIKAKWREAQKSSSDTLRTWETAILRGNFDNVCAGEIKKYIKEQKIPYQNENMDIVKIEENNMSSYPLLVTNYIDNTQKFWEKQPFFYNNQKMFWLWNNDLSKWRYVDETDMLLAIENNLKLSGEIITSATKNNYLESFRRIGRKKMPKDTPKDWIQFKNKIYDLKTDTITQVTTEFFFTNPLPWELGESEDTPNMDRIFEQWVGEKYVKTLYEIIAFCTLNHYTLQRIFCLEGAGSNGKSKFLELIQKFIGKENIASSSLDLIMENRFESSKLYKKLVCMMGETNYAQAKKTEMLKRLTGNDQISYEFKNKDPFTGENYAKLLIATNSLPETFDRTDGFYRRWLIIRFPNQFTEKIDILGQIPDKEYNNLARKSISILKDLLKNREFTNEGTIEQRREKYEQTSNPLNSFIDEYCIKDINEEIPFFKFFDMFEIYLKSNGKRELTKMEVSSRLDKLGYEIKKQGVQINNKFTTWNYIIGLKIKDKHAGLTIKELELLEKDIENGLKEEIDKNKLKEQKSFTTFTAFIHESDHSPRT